MRKLNALIVDGDEASKNTIEKLLNQSGFEVKTTDLGYEGLDLA